MSCDAVTLYFGSEHEKSGQTWMVFWWKDTLEESRISQFPSDLSQDNIILWLEMSNKVIRENMREKRLKTILIGHVTDF